MVADHSSRLTDVNKEELPLEDSFPENKLFELIQNEVNWHIDFIIYLTVVFLPLDMNYQ